MVLCLPGWGDTISSFSKLTEYLKDNYAVVAVDLPGFGGTQAPSKAWGLEDYALFTADFLKKIKVLDTYAVIGHSYGGATAIVGVSKSYLNCDKLVLMASSGVRDLSNLRKNGLKILAKIAKLPLYLTPAHTRKRLRKKIYSAVGSDMLLLPHMEPTFKKIIKQDIRVYAESVNTPTLLIYGSEDNQTPISQARLLDESFPSSQLEIIEGANHFLQQDNADLVAKLILQFLRDK